MKVNDDMRFGKFEILSLWLFRELTKWTTCKQHCKSGKLSNKSWLSIDFPGILTELKKLLADRYNKGDDDRREIESILHTELDEELEQKKEVMDRKGVVEQEQLKLLQQHAN